MGGVTFLLILMTGVCLLLGLLPVLQAERRSQERDGLFGAAARRHRLQLERSSATSAAGRAAEEDASAMLLVETARRLARQRPVLERIETTGRGWWYLRFADGTVMLLQSTSQRTLRRLQRQVGRLPVTLAGVTRLGDLNRIVLHAVHRPIAVEARAVTVAR
jgi:hypothetical protein